MTNLDHFRTRGEMKREGMSIGDVPVEDIEARELQGIELLDEDGNLRWGERKKL